MKWNQFLGGILIGLGFGLMFGAGIVLVPQERAGHRTSDYPVFPSMALLVAGVIISGLWRRRKDDPGGSQNSVAERNTLSK